MTALVTGGSGFIGRHLVRRLLEEGQQVRVLDVREPDFKDVEVVLGDLGDPATVDRAVAGADVIYHLAVVRTGTAAEHVRGTVTGTANVVESALKHRVSKLVYLSTIAILDALAAHRNRQPVTEDWPLDPNPEKRGRYSQIKFEAEQIVLKAVRERKLGAVILRPAQVIGPGAPLVTRAVARRLDHTLLMFGDPNLVLPLVYVDDLVDAIRLAAESKFFDGSIFHIIDPAEITKAELVRQYAAANKFKIVRIPLFAFCVFAFGMELAGKILRRPPPYSVYRVRSVVAPMRFDCTRAEKLLGWRPRVGVRAGVEITLKHDTAR
jgi:nucleoside-diphosphate-sugar epimerase